MSICPTFASPLAPVITRYLDLMTALGRGYATERRVFYLLDAFLVAEHASELTPEVFERWCRTQAHLKSGIQRTQMRMVRNLCLYRRRTEPDCFIPDIAFFPPCHQYAPPYLLTEDEMVRLIATTRLLYTTSASPLRAQAIRVGVVLLYTAGLRRGELLRLTLRDYDPQTHTLLIRASKFHKSRLLPLSADAVAELAAYLAGRRAARPDTLTEEAPLIWKGRGCMMSATVLPSTPWCAGTALALTSTPNCPSYRRIWGTCPLPLPSTICALSNRWRAPPVSASRSITATY